MYSIFTLGVALWLLYGVILGSWPIIIANTITLGLAGTVLFLRVRHKYLPPMKSGATQSDQ